MVADTEAKGFLDGLKALRNRRSSGCIRPEDLNRLLEAANKGQPVNWAHFMPRIAGLIAFLLDELDHAESRVYEAVVAETEGAEHRGNYLGNGHHLAQRLAGLAASHVRTRFRAVVLREAGPESEEIEYEEYDRCAECDGAVTGACRSCSGPPFRRPVTRGRTDG